MSNVASFSENKEKFAHFRPCQKFQISKFPEGSMPPDPVSVCTFTHFIIGCHTLSKSIIYRVRKWGSSNHDSSTL